MLHIGNNNYISKDKILAITVSETAPMRRVRMNAEDTAKIIDCAGGKKTKSFVHLRDGFLALSALSPEALRRRLNE